MRRQGSIALLQLPVLVALAGLAAGCSLIDAMDGYGEAKELQSVGVAAQAKILSIADTGITVNEDPVIRLAVEVRPADGPPYQATIKRLLVSRLEVAQYQPGTVIGVRYDPKDPSRVSIDLCSPKAARTGDPFRDNFTPSPAAMGGSLEPAPPAPELYRGGTDDQADTRALLENGYVPMGASGFHGGAANASQAVAQGKRIGATLVVLYGESSGAAPGGLLAPLPFHPRLPGGAAESGGQGAQGASPAAGQAAIGSLPPPPKGEHTATYWAKLRPPVLGVYSRPLDDQEKTRMMRNDGMVVVEVANGSPAAAARIQEGDVIIAIDGKAILDTAAVPAFLNSIAGRQVRIDLLRNGTPLAVTAQLNPPAAP
jgi:hypothetical protein